MNDPEINEQKKGKKGVFVHGCFCEILFGFN
jgi:hypothetical protein